MVNRFDYHYGNEAEQYSFYRIPKVLITDNNFKNLTIDAKLLYGLMLDRMSLSIKSGWLDEVDRVFIYFTLDDIMEQLNCQHGKAVKLLAELDLGKGIGLIERIKQGQGRPAKIYVLKICSNHKISVEKPDKLRLPKSRNQEFSISEMQTSENRKSRLPETGSADFRKSDPNNTEINKPELIELNRSIHPSRLIDVDGYREQIQENIEYDILFRQYSRTQLDEIVELLVETLCKKSEIIKIGSEDFPSLLVKTRLLKLDRFHIEYVIDCMRKNTTQIRNIKQYMLKTLFNAPITMDHYYQAAVNHDFYDKRE